MRVCALVAVALATGCGGGSDAPSPEVVVEDAGSGDVTIIGASDTHVFWTAGAQIDVASLDALPAAATGLAATTGRVAFGGDSIVYEDGTTLAAVDIDGTTRELARDLPETFAAGEASLPAVPLVARSTGPDVGWGTDDATTSTTLTKVDRCDHFKVTRGAIYAAVDGAGTRRLVRIDQRNGDATPATGSTIWAPMFPGGGADGATFTGRIIDADDDSVLWLVEEMPSRRGLLVVDPTQGEPSVVLEHIADASGFFASETSLYWQEGSELLTAPREGGPASILASLPGPAGALADGYLYFVHGQAIERLRVE